MLFEDAHWSDATSRELLGLSIDQLQRLPIALVVTFRPEFKPPWGNRPYLASLTLDRLSGSDGAMLVAHLAGDQPLSDDVVDEIVERTDGVPLFVEELTKAVLESPDRDDQLTAAGSSTSALAVPATLHASLISRLDRLGTAAKEVAQIGAVLGREFSHDLIQHVAHRPDLETALEQLTRAGLLFCRGLPPASSYLFKHALVQDAAYSTLLRRRRQRLHSRIATVLEQSFDDVVERQPELLAHHLTGAGETKRAIGQWLKAAQYAAARVAYVEAAAHLERGLALLPSLPETTERDSLELDLALALGMSSIRTKGMISPAVREAYARASELAVKLGSDQLQFQALYGVWQHHVGSSRIIAARPLVDQLLSVTARDGADPGLRLQAHHAAWTTLIFAGEGVTALEHCQIGRQRYDPTRYQSHRDLYGGHDAGVCAWLLGSQAEWLLGYADTAVNSGAEAMALAEQISHPVTAVSVFSYVAVPHLLRREPELVLARLDSGETLAAEYRISALLSPRILRGAALFFRGEIRDAIDCLREGLPPGRTGGLRTAGFCLLAEALTQQGEYAEALAGIDESLRTVEATGEGFFTAELHRVHGIVLLAQNQLAESEVHFRKSLKIARDQQAKSWELRTATSLARMWAEQGRRSEAHDLLAPIYSWFTEGHDTFDLRDAKALLDEL
jgi:tetratricopeptide (TPR) repeat protein